MCNNSFAIADTITLQLFTRSSAIAEGPRDASCQLKSCQLPRSSAETILVRQVLKYQLSLIDPYDKNRAVDSA